MPYSDGFKINVNKLNADEALLVLLEIEHPMITGTLRMVADNVDLISLTENYLAMNFRMERQSDIQGELPKIKLIIPNIGRTLTKWIDSSNGGRDAKITTKLVRRSSPDLIEESIEFGVQSININTQNVTINLVIQNNLVKRSMKWVYDTVHAPGLF